MKPYRRMFAYVFLPAVMSAANAYTAHADGLDDLFRSAGTSWNPIRISDSQVKAAAFPEAIQTQLNADTYLAQKVREADIVMLGEFHRSQKEVNFFSRNIASLVKAGVENFAFEFLSSSDQEEIDRFMNSSEYLNDAPKRRKKIVELLFKFNCVFTVMAYKDYVDAIENIYKLRQSDHPDIRLVGDGCNISYTDGGDNCLGTRITRDEHMANILTGVNGKTLWYGGMHHGSNLPFRTGGLLKNRPGKKVLTIASLNEKDDYIGSYFAYPEISSYIMEQLPKPYTAIDVAMLNKDFNLVSHTSGKPINFRLSDKDKLGKVYDGFLYIADSEDILTNQCAIGTEYRDFINTEVLAKLSEAEKRTVGSLLQPALSEPIPDDKKEAIEDMNDTPSPANYFMKQLFNISYDRTGKVFTDDDRKTFLQYITLPSK